MVGLDGNVIWTRVCGGKGGHGVSDAAPELEERVQNKYLRILGRKG